MESLPLTAEARRLVAHLEALETQAPDTGTTYHVAGIGGGFYLAYEQLRNAATYRERHLLLRGAIERFLRRDFKWHSGDKEAAVELVVELTQAGYLKNDTVPTAKIDQIDELLVRYSRARAGLVEREHVKPERADGWLYQIASAQIEDFLVPNRRLAVVMSFAYEHYLQSVPPPVIAPDDDELAYPIALYCAMQRSIFKSDIATTRYYCLAGRLARLTEHDLTTLARTNILLDELYQAPQTNRLARLINRYGAPMRVLRELLTDTGVVPATMTDRGATLARLKRLTELQYQLTHRHLRGQIAKALLFIFITKTLLGVGIEVPYDLAVHGAIDWLPLVLNIVFPVIYMIVIGARISTPGRQNTELVVDYADRILYQTARPTLEYRIRRRVSSSSLGVAFNVVYTVGFLISFGLVTWALYRLGFTLVSGIIFFVFLSAVSFLAFRLRQSARELAILDERQGLLQTLTDFLSTPFVRLGYWLSDRYAKLNIVAAFLDVAIEMPLKTTLRLVRQWVGFMRDKQEEI
jgi:hypothetical protein